MGETAILIAAHKPFDPPALEGYLPVQVGAALAQKDLGFQRDDEGENISVKNPQYCELTAQYWAWKNLTGPRVMGLVHYRRYFVKDMYAPDVKSQILTAAEADALLEKYDIVLPKPVYKLAYNGTLYHSKPREGQDKPLLLLEDIVTRRCPEYLPSFEKFVYGHRASFGNMLVAKREVFCAYSAWMFPLLEEFGFAAEDFGGGALIVRRAPFDVDPGDIEATLTEIARKLLSTGSADPAAARDELLHTMACKAAIKGGWVSDPAELRVLVDRVQSGEIKYCPHGRPVAVKLTKYELEKMFKRA